MVSLIPSVAMARVIVDELAASGVTDAVVAPGSRSAPLAMALHADPRLRMHVRIDERSAAFLALGLGRATGRPAVVVCTSGSAAANFHPAVIEADLGRAPLLVLTADRPPELRQTGANQTIQQPGIYSGAVRWATDMGVAEGGSALAQQNRYWRSVASRAVGAALGVGGPPGPVHLNVGFREPLVPDRDGGGPDAAVPGAPLALPEDLAGRAGGGAAASGTPPALPDDLAGRAGGAPWVTFAGVGTAAGGAGDVDARATDDLDGGAGVAPGGAATEPRAAVGGVAGVVAAWLGRWERGLIVAGDGVDDPAAVAALAEQLGWPLLAEPHSGARRGANALTAYDRLLRSAAFIGAHPPEAVVVFGRVGLSKALLTLLGTGLPQVVVDPHVDWPDPARATQMVVPAPAGSVARGLCQVLDGPVGPSAWLDAWRSADRAVGAAVDGLLRGEGVSEPQVARDTAAAVPAGGALVVASSMSIRDVDLIMAPRGDVRVVANRGASGIDGFVSTAVGVALAHQGPTVALAGDLSLLHDANGLLTGRPQPDLVIVVVNNDGGGIFSFLPQAAFPQSFEDVFGTPHGVDPAEIAATAGVGHRRVDSAAGFVPALTGAIAAGGLQLLEVRTDRAANKQLHDDLQAAAVAALEHTLG